jgi:sugar phosphate isomerase/epimerase
MPLSRRDVLAMSTAAVAASALPSTSPAADSAEPFGYCFNTSTVRGQKLPVEEIAKLASKAGYGGIEPWIMELQDYTKRGGSLKDLGKLLSDLGLSVESAIGFAKWIVDDDLERQKGLDEAKRDIEMVKTIGGKRLAAPPAGATDKHMADLRVVADRYRALAELGAKFDLVPEAEVWGFSKTMSQLGDAVCVAMESGHPKACVLPDIFHLYKGGSGYDSLKLISGKAIGIFHMNDYPKDKDRAFIKDADRVFPGDGVAPLADVFRTLRDSGYRGMLSLELFNPEYYKRDAYEVVKTGIDKMRAAVKAAFS